MIKKYSSVYSGIIISLLTFLFIFLSLRYLDATIAERVIYILRSIRPLQHVTKHIPDFLPDLVVIGTILMWIIYFFRKHKGINDSITKFLLVAATTLPVSYAAKTFFKYIFGRTGPRDWLLYKYPLKFHWFHSGSFPSGHMTVFVAFGAAVLFYFPQYRRQVIIFLILLGVALIGTDYHFLSDVIAGAYLGFVTTCSIRYIFREMGVKI